MTSNVGFYQILVQCSSCQSVPKMLKFESKSHPEYGKAWKSDYRVCNLLAETGFNFMPTINFDFQTYGYVLDAMIELYDLENECFVIGGQKLLPTLGDVALIMGLPIDGEPVTGQDFKPDICRDMCNTYLGSEDFFCGSNAEKSSDIDLRLLRWLMTVPDASAGRDLDKHVRAHVLYFIGACLCQARGLAKVPSMYLDVLKDTGDIKKYAGDGSLGSLFLLVLLFSYVPSLAKDIFGLEMSDLKKFTVGVEWSNFFASPSQNKHRKLWKKTDLVNNFQETLPGRAGPA